MLAGPLTTWRAGELPTARVNAARPARLVLGVGQHDSLFDGIAGGADRSHAWGAPAGLGNDDDGSPVGQPDRLSVGIAHRQRRVPAFIDMAGIAPEAATGTVAERVQRTTDAVNAEPADGDRDQPAPRRPPPHRGDGKTCAITSPLVR